jgi:hypothetical protein
MPFVVSRLGVPSRTQRTPIDREYIVTAPPAEPRAGEPVIPLPARTPGSRQRHAEPRDAIAEIRKIHADAEAGLRPV